MHATDLLPSPSPPSSPPHHLPLSCIHNWTASRKTPLTCPVCRTVQPVGVAGLGMWTQNPVQNPHLHQREDPHLPHLGRVTRTGRRPPLFSFFCWRGKREACTHHPACRPTRRCVPPLSSPTSGHLPGPGRCTPEGAADRRSPAAAEPADRGPPTCYSRSFP